VTIVATTLSVWHPFVNAFALMLLAIPVVYMIYHEMQITKDKRVYNLAVRSTTVLAIAIFCWINDRVFCDAWSAINFPYLHGVWHILIFIAAYTACVLFSYFFVRDENPEKGPMLKFWPYNEWELGIPYVTIKMMDGKDEI
jgi:alkaline ceramidase